jgi:polar amino acid transport system permease protein
VNYVFQFGTVWPELDKLVLGTWLTLRLSAMTMVLGLAVGVLGALAKASSWRVLRAFVHGYVEAVRNTPFLVQLLLVYLGLPALGLRLSPDQAALLAMVVNLGAYATEIVRAGIEAVPHGQIEAGRALGLRPRHIFRFVVLVPALRTVFPALGSQFILVMLASSVVSVISAEELTAVADTIIARNFRSFEFYFIITGIYLVLSLAFQAVFATIDRVLFGRWSAHA